MITLTNTIPVTTVLGSGSKAAYDRLDIVTIHYDVIGKSVTGQCQLVSSAIAQAAPIQGVYSIPTSGQAILTVTIPTLPFYASVALTSPQQAVVQGWITSAQNTVEAGLISVAVVTGTQAPGV